MRSRRIEAPGRFPARERPPRLVLRFAIFTALGLAGAAAVILVVDRRADTVQAERQAIARARFATEAVLKEQLRPSDLAGRMTRERRRQLDRLFGRRVLLEGVRRGTLYSAGGRIAYSTGGPPGPGVETTYVREAVGGTVVSHVGRAEDGTRVLQTYVPVVLGGSGLTGVVLLEQEYAPVEAAAQASSWLIAGVLEALLVLLFVIFVPVLARVSARIRAQIERLEHVASHDELMGLPNRLGFREAFEAALAGDGRSGALLLIDLDGFHEINDAIGSERGDRVLVLVAERLRRELADAALVARLGEDEFGLLLPGAGRTEIAAVAERARRALAPSFEVEGVRVAVDASAGAALFPEHGVDFDTLLRRAGVALSIAKAEGQSDLQIYNAGHDASDVSQLALAAELREALDAGQLLVYYQPQADLSTRAVRGVEALVRWQHPQRGLLSAAAFIDQAERSGLAKELGRFVLDSAARQWRIWRSFGIKLELAVNLSPTDVLDVSLPDEIAALLERHRLPADDLVLEITERTLIGDERRTTQVLERLVALGVRLAIDDFGTGNSSLSCLRRLPFRQVKLDRSFLAGVPGDAADETIVRSIVSIAHALHATVVAEGVETLAQWQRTGELGCDIGQGYLIGRPLPADEITTMLLAIPGARAVVVAA